MATNVAKKRKNIFARKPLTQTNQLHGTQDSDSSSSDDVEEDSIIQKLQKKS